MTVYNRLLFILTGIVIATATLAAESATPLRPMVVSATRTPEPSVPIPTNITVITREDIAASNARTLTQILRGRAGIQISDLFGDGSTATIDMRGFGPTASSNTLVMVDGRRLNNSSDIATLDLNVVDLNDVERIEIIEGSAGILFGNQAVGGAINIITKRPQDFRATAAAGAGSYDGNELSARVTDRLDNGLSYRLSANRRRTDNYRDNNDLDLDRGKLRLDFDHPGGNLFFEYNYVSEDLETPGSLFKDEIDARRKQSAAVFADDFSNTDSSIGRFGLSQSLDEHWTLGGDITYRDNDRNFIASFRSFGPGTESTQDRLVRAVRPRLTGRYPVSGGDVLITTGIDYENTSYKLDTSFGSTKLSQKLKSIYAQAVIPLNTQLSATVGIRHARVDNGITTSFTGKADPDDDVTIGSGGLLWRPNSDWRLFARAAGNYRFASVDEHTNVVFGTPVGIDTQTGISYEAGAELARAGMLLKATVYRLEVDDEISFDSTGFANINLDETTRNGLILESQWNISSRLRTGGSYTFTDAEITDGSFDGNDIPLVARHSGQLFVDARALPHLNVLAEVVLTSNRTLSGDFNNDFDKLSGYGVLNLAGNYEQGPWRLGARVNNLLDKEYSDSGAIGFDETFVIRDAYFTAPEINFWFTASYTFGN